MRITVLKDIKPITDAFVRIGLSIELGGSKGIFSHPERYATVMIGVIVWAVALFTYTMEYLADVDKIVAAMTINVQLCLTTSKNFIFLARRERFLRLNEALERLALTGNNIERELWNTSNRRVLPITMAYSISCQMTVSICVLLPILKLLYYYIWHNEVVLTLPLPGIFPYDYTVPFYFILTTILSVLLVYFCVYTICAVDGLFGWFVYNISAHLQIMRLKLEQLLQLHVDDPNFQRDLVALVNYHRQIIDLSLELDALYAPIIFLEVTSSSLPICFLAYQLSYLSDPASVPFMCLLMSSIVIQLMIYCFGGEKVQNECDQLCENIYLLIPWHKLPPKHCRLLLNPFIRSQRVLVLTGYFFTANRSLLVWIFRTAGSFTAMLFALKEKEV
ncbi:odorant receptor 45a-like [Zeugodacus cucurbitae]|uniref:odorant receptor 45a-like n=1 Tax=Zeugodacus cucurbitae TaxID=28588 RepID=UPI0023D912C4|nr:odorant receptor 45a-like [Zeugodacus cucurbitae]